MKIEEEERLLFAYKTSHVFDKTMGFGFMCCLVMRLLTSGLSPPTPGSKELMGFVGDPSGTAKDFSPSISVLSCHYHFSNAPFSSR